MCEINPKRKQFYRLEFFTSQEISDDHWKFMVAERLVFLEQMFNETGEIRVHVHEDKMNPSKAGKVKSEAKAKSSRENGKLGGRPRKT